MKNRYNNFKKLGGLLLIAILAWSCVKDLDTEPLDPSAFTSDKVFDNPDSYKEFLAKIYGSLTLTGQQGQYGKPEIEAQDEGTTSFLRVYWSAQEVTTDEAINAWNDPGLVEFHGHIWSDDNLYLKLLYQRIFINIAYANEYIREVGSRAGDVSGSLKTDVNYFLNEARFLRAFYYYTALDFWGNVPFVTEKDKTGAFLPDQIKRADLFEYIEKELLDIEKGLMDARTNEYARADKAAAWMLLAKLYLNAEVYLGAGNSRYTECLTYLNKVIDAGYSLAPVYANLFLTDNNISNNEAIFVIAEDGSNTQNYGGVTYIVNAATGTNNAYMGVSSGWYGNRPTNTFIQKFDTANDARASFDLTGHTADITNPADFTQGYFCTKFRNVSSEGVSGQNTTFVDTDFPVFRLADAYLMYAEAVLRGGQGGTIAGAVGYVNQLRERAFGNTDNNIDAAGLSLDFIIDERARELYWEAHRRTDLIRFGLFTGDDYLWDWKGDVKEGQATGSHLALFPLPAFDRAVNTKLKQNEGYGN
ncbi:MAG: RagB/SusD family nutrient uptake outer membrane protein [Bacteroidales bacterium]|nr:RagB/SusD family nutrient uptake outer membrane protein [Bacteroidales bacterium]